MCQFLPNSLAQESLHVDLLVKPYHSDSQLRVQMNQGFLLYEYKWTRGPSSTTACRWSLSSARQSQSTPSYPSSLISTSILPSNLYFHLPNSLFYSGFTTKHLVCISLLNIQQYQIFILWMSQKQTHWYSVYYWMMLSTAKIMWHHLQMNELAWSTGAIILTEKTKVLCSSATLSTTNPTWIRMGSKLGLQSETNNKLPELWHGQKKQEKDGT